MPMPGRHYKPKGCFTTATRPWLPLPDEHRARAVGVQTEDANSCLSSTRALLAGRRANGALRDGRLTMPPCDDPLLTVHRHGAGEAAAIGIFNLGAEIVHIKTPAPELAQVNIAGFNADRRGG